MNRENIRTCITLVIGFGAGLAFVVGCPMAGDFSGEIDGVGPSRATAATGGEEGCTQWEVSRTRLDHVPTAMPVGREPFAVVHIPHDYYDDWYILTRSCI
ncbi:hypothetical protein [Nannocystis sp. SCPEA4]|uniref:hypothetical protein n=1 Tax=Nannocystis sp. SCPEA4 TaxID=2996787 RepID=UPI00226D432B|nr:hypothetical protein [Nannocystis sp. SCPEA4]MCY1061546.1 hypothetical protein [Nannocystis sp. SCPEA4]